MDLAHSKKVKKRALVTGSFGQDGSYLIEYLLQKNYQITATYYPKSQMPDYLIPLKNQVEFIPLDISDFKAFKKILTQHFYDEIYNLAAITFIPNANQSPLTVKVVNADAVCFILDFLATNHLSTKLFQPSSAHIFDFNQPMPLNLNSKINPTEPYGISKAQALFWTRFYRQHHYLYAVNGILFNHESPRRPNHFVIPKIITQAIEIKNHKRQFIELGNIDIARDWGWAPDFVKAMWLSLQQPTPNDYIIATGQAHPLTDVIKIVFDYLDIKDWSSYVKINQKFVRPDDPPVIYGDIKLTKKQLKWQPETGFKDMIIKMIKAKLNAN